MKKTTLTGRALSVVLSLAIASHGTLAQAAEASVWSDRQKRRSGAVLLAGIPGGAAVSSAPSALQSLPRPDLRTEAIPHLGSRDMGLTELLGRLPAGQMTLRNVRWPKGAPRGTVIHIQDVHANAEAQTRIGAAVAALASSGRIAAVGLEGGAFDISLTRLRAMGTPRGRALAAAALESANLISGPVAALWLADKATPRITGIDDPTLHAENAEAWRSASPYAAEYRHQLAALARKLDDAKAALFSPELLELDRAASAYRLGEDAVGPYARRLARGGGEVPPQIQKLLRAMDREERLNLSAVDAQRRRLLALLTSRMSREALGGLLSDSLAFRAGQIGPEEFYRSLRARCQHAGVPLAEFPAMNAYIEYVIEAESLDGAKLLEELRRLEIRRYAALVRSPEESRLVSDSVRLDYARKLVDFSLTPEEWLDYDRLRDASFGADSTLTAPLRRLPHLADFELFYVTALKRDRQLAERLARTLEHGAPTGRRSTWLGQPRDGAAPASVEDGIERGATPYAVAVTGGFHTGGLQRHLARRGLACVTLTPRLTRADVTGASNYLTLFAQEKTPIERLFRGDKLFLAKNPMAPDVQTGVAPLAVLLAERGLGHIPNGNVTDIFRAGSGAEVRSVTLETSGRTTLALVDRPNGLAAMAGTMRGDVLELDLTPPLTITEKIKRRLWSAPLREARALDTLNVFALMRFALIAHTTTGGAAARAFQAGFRAAGATLIAFVSFAALMLPAAALAFLLTSPEPDVLALVGATAAAVLVFAFGQPVRLAVNILSHAGYNAAWLMIEIVLALAGLEPALPYLTKPDGRTETDLGRITVTAGSPADLKVNRNPAIDEALRRLRRAGAAGDAAVQDLVREIMASATGGAIDAGAARLTIEPRIADGTTRLRLVFQASTFSTQPAGWVPVEQARRLTEMGGAVTTAFSPEGAIVDIILPAAPAVADTGLSRIDGRTLRAPDGATYRVAVEATGDWHVATVTRPNAATRFARSSRVLAFLGIDRLIEAASKPETVGQVLLAPKTDAAPSVVHLRMRTVGIHPDFRTDNILALVLRAWDAEAGLPLDSVITLERVTDNRGGEETDWSAETAALQACGFDGLTIWDERGARRESLVKRATPEPDQRAAEPLKSPAGVLDLLKIYSGFIDESFHRAGAALAFVPVNYALSRLWSVEAETHYVVPTGGDALSAVRRTLPGVFATFGWTALVVLFGAHLFMAEALAGPLAVAIQGGFLAAVLLPKRFVPLWWIGVAVAGVGLGFGAAMAFPVIHWILLIHGPLAVLMLIGEIWSIAARRPGNSFGLEPATPRARSARDERPRPATHNSRARYGGHRSPLPGFLMMLADLGTALRRWWNDDAPAALKALREGRGDADELERHLARVRVSRADAALTHDAADWASARARIENPDDTFLGADAGADLYGDDLTAFFNERGRAAWERRLEPQPDAALAGVLTRSGPAGYQITLAALDPAPERVRAFFARAGKPDAAETALRLIALGQAEQTLLFDMWARPWSPDAPDAERHGSITDFLNALPADIRPGFTLAATERQTARARAALLVARFGGDLTDGESDRLIWELMRLQMSADTGAPDFDLLPAARRNEIARVRESVFAAVRRMRFNPLRWMSLPGTMEGALGASFNQAPRSRLDDDLIPGGGPGGGPGGPRFVMAGWDAIDAAGLAALNIQAAATAVGGTVLPTISRENDDTARQRDVTAPLPIRPATEQGAGRGAARRDGERAPDTAPASSSGDTARGTRTADITADGYRGVDNTLSGSANLSVTDRATDIARRRDNTRNAGQVNDDARRRLDDDGRSDAAMSRVTGNIDDPDTANTAALTRQRNDTAGDRLGRLTRSGDGVPSPRDRTAPREGDGLWTATGRVFGAHISPAVLPPALRTQLPILRAGMLLLLVAVTAAASGTPSWEAASAAIALSALLLSLTAAFLARGAAPAGPGTGTGLLRAVRDVTALALALIGAPGGASAETIALREARAVEAWVTAATTAPNSRSQQVLSPRRKPGPMDSGLRRNDGFEQTSRAAGAALRRDAESLAALLEAVHSQSEDGRDGRSASEILSAAAAGRESGSGLETDFQRLALTLHRAALGRLFARREALRRAGLEREWRAAEEAFAARAAAGPARLKTAALLWMAVIAEKPSALALFERRMKNADARELALIKLFNDPLFLARLERKLAELRGEPGDAKPAAQRRTKRAPAARDGEQAESDETEDDEDTDPAARTPGGVRVLMLSVNNGVVTVSNRDGGTAEGALLDLAEGRLDAADENDVIGFANAVDRADRLARALGRGLEAAQGDDAEAGRNLARTLATRSLTIDSETVREAARAARALSDDARRTLFAADTTEDGLAPGARRPIDRFATRIVMSVLALGAAALVGTGIGLLMPDTAWALTAVAALGAAVTAALALTRDERGTAAPRTGDAESPEAIAATLTKSRDSLAERLETTPGAVIDDILPEAGLYGVGRESTTGELWRAEATLFEAVGAALERRARLGGRRLNETDNRKLLGGAYLASRGRDALSAPSPDKDWALAVGGGTRAEIARERDRVRRLSSLLKNGRRLTLLVGSDADAALFRDLAGAAVQLIVVPGLHQGTGAARRLAMGAVADALDAIARRESAGDRARAATMLANTLLLIPTGTGVQTGGLTPAQAEVLARIGLFLMQESLMGLTIQRYQLERIEILARAIGSAA